METQVLNNWTQGLDVLSDPRRLKPNSKKETTAGSPDMENVEITKQGALITSKGYEVVSEISSTGGIKSLLDYDKDDDTRNLIFTHGVKHYSISLTNTTWSDTNLGVYGSKEADFVGGTVYKGDAVTSSGTITITSYGDMVSGSNQDQIKIVNNILKAQTGAATAGEETFQAATSNNATASSLALQINSKSGLKQLVKATVSGAIVTLKATNPGVRAYAIEYIDNTGTTAATTSGATLTGGTDGRIAIIGTGESTNANSVKKIDLTNAMSNALDGSVNGSYISAEFMERLFVAKGRTVYYSKINDEDHIEGAIGYNDIVTGLHPEGTRMEVLTRSYNQGINLTYDSNNFLTLPQKEPFKRKYGCLAHKTLKPVYSNMVYWSNFGVMKLGTEESFDELGVPRPQSMSVKIDPALEKANFTPSAAKKACGIFDPFEQQYYLSLPYDGAEYNNRTFVYNWNFDAWTMRTGLAPDDWAFFRDSTDTRDSKYLTDHFSSRLLRMNDGYSYAGGGYTRKWKSKKFTHGTDFQMKKWYYIKVAGSMYTTTNFKIKAEIDGKTEEWTVDDNALEQDKFENYIGDDLLGDINLGGDTVESKFKRFKTKIEIPSSIREGFEMQLTIFNDAAEQPWKVDFIEIGYDYISPRQIPAKHINNNKL